MYLNGKRMIGFGTYQVKDPVILDAAVNSGYNFFDTAQLYKNEHLVIDLIKRHPDKELYVSTKLSYIMLEKGKLEEAFMTTIEKFGQIKINLLLLHKPTNNCRRDWEQLCELYLKFRDRIDHIGVSNYDIIHLEQIADLPIQPFCNQIELTPFYTRKDLTDHCKSKNIIVTSHTSLTRGNRFNCDVLNDLAAKYEATNANILLTWCRQNGYFVIPRSENIEHMTDNLKTEYVLGNEDMNKLNSLNDNYAITKVMF